MQKLMSLYTTETCLQRTFVLEPTIPLWTGFTVVQKFVRLGYSLTAEILHERALLWRFQYLILRFWKFFRKFVIVMDFSEKILSIH
jgi:hypothetical protein